jgi:plasmid stabilization system protein ParE
VAIIALAPRALADLKRLRAFLLETDPAAAEQTVALILSGIAVIEHHPLIGRPVEAALRELVISRGKSGYVALYRYDEIRDRALVLTIRHQRETGCVE